MTLPLISIVGPTAVGKTTAAFEIAHQLLDIKKFQGIDIISADSRQVYKAMELVTGADVPVNFVPTTDPQLKYPFYESQKIRIHGLSLIKPNEEWSVTHFRELVFTVLETTQKNNRLPIIVGGTGLYHAHLFTTDTQLDVPPNYALRAELSAATVHTLQTKLQGANPDKWSSMNNSDQQNPRRLLRALEIEVFTQNHPHSSSEHLSENLPFEINQLVVGLTDQLKTIESKIRQRVEERLATGVVTEIEQLMAQYDDQEWRGQAFTATGVKEVRALIEGVLDREKCVELWSRREFQYAKRQLTWWKKYSPSRWFDVANADFNSKLLTAVQEFL